MWFKKKKEEPVLDRDDWIKKLLAEYNLLDVNNLIELANIEKDKVNKVKLEEALKYLQPGLMKQVKLGHTSYYTEWMEDKEAYALPFWAADFSKLQKYGVSINTEFEYNPYLTEISKLEMKALVVPEDLMQKYSSYKPKIRFSISLRGVKK